MSVDQVRLMAATMEDGETVREVCPYCLGGSSGEKSFNLTLNNGSLLWKCHRASCNIKGGCGTNGSLTRVSAPKAPKQPRFTSPTEPLSEQWQRYLAGKIGWTEWHRTLSRAVFAPIEHRVALPIRDPFGARRGWVLRSYDPHPRSKTLTYMDKDEPHLSWYRPNNMPRVVVVEDIPSAVRVAKYADSVAINGGGLGPEYVHEIATHYKHVVWALDADATAQAINLHRVYGLGFESSTVMVLEEDFKDMNEDTLKEYLQ